MTSYRLYAGKNELNVSWLDGDYLKTVADKKLQRNVVFLDHVWWLDLKATLNNIPSGTYELIWRIKFHKNFFAPSNDCMKVNVSYSISSLDAPAAAAAAAARVSDDEANTWNSCMESVVGIPKCRGEWVSLSFGHLTFVHEEQDVKITFYDHESHAGTKGNISWDFVELVPVFSLANLSRKTVVKNLKNLDDIETLPLPQKEKKCLKNVGESFFGPNVRNEDAIKEPGNWDEEYWDWPVYTSPNTPHRDKRSVSLDQNSVPSRRGFRKRFRKTFLNIFK